MLWLEVINRRHIKIQNQTVRKLQINRPSWAGLPRVVSLGLGLKDLSFIRSSELSFPNKFDKA